MITVIRRGMALEKVLKIEPVEPPNAGRRWKPVRHGDLINTIKGSVKDRGWAVAEERYAVAREGADMVGALMFRNVGGLKNLPGMQFAIGFLNSNARRKALKLTVGAHIACCSNGMCTGTILLNRVHDHTVKLEGQINAALDRYEDNARSIPEMVEALRGRRLADEEASHYILEAGRRGLIGWAAVGRVDREYRAPTFPEHGTGTSWALLNAFTYAARPNIAPTRQMEAYNEFRLLLPCEKN